MNARIILLAGLLVSPAAAVAQGACALQRASTAAPSADVPALLARFPTGGGGLSTEIRNLAAANPGSVPDIVAGAGGGNAAQGLAIGTGLGAAATLCLPTQAQTSRMIQKAVVDAGNADVTRGFEGVTGDVLTTATTTAANASGPVADTGGSGIGGGTRPRPTENGGGAVVPSSTLLTSGLSATISQRASVFRP